MKTVEYIETPEKLKHAIYSLQLTLHQKNQFDGSFRKGKINGVYFSNLWIERRKIFSFVLIRGVYNLKTGSLKFTVSKSIAFYISVGFWMLFAVAPFFMIARNDRIPNAVLSVPVGMACLAIAVYFIVYHRNEKEFIRLVRSYFKDDLED